MTKSVCISKMTIKEIHQEFSRVGSIPDDKNHVIVSGSIVSTRDYKKGSFTHLKDNTGQIQIYVRPDSIGRKEYLNYLSCDVGDIIKVTGQVFYTRTHELTILVSEVEIL